MRFRNISYMLILALALCPLSSEGATRRTNPQNRSNAPQAQSQPQSGSGENMTPEEADKMLNKESGLLGISGVSADNRDIEKAIDETIAWTRVWVQTKSMSVLDTRTICIEMDREIRGYLERRKTE